MSGFSSDDGEREQREQRRRQEKEDLCALLETGPGYRFFYRLVAALGAGGMTAGENDQIMKNIAEQLLDQAAEANPEAYLSMMGQLRGIHQGGKYA